MNSGGAAMRHSQHARVNIGTPVGYSRFHFEPTRGTQKMPLLFYFPFIVWMGLMEIAQDEMRIPVRVKARTSSQR